ncbi:anti-sigma factor RsbA family regulatory protein [Streptomyces sp. WAC08241]|uniref:anti-sigma factor RsbA family regulatory protein n=1 Tax=Streptomyces sp. WAC08241 TaxID=2487421 RepID=UPI000F7A2850|nr:anti-sigma factor RsbA family regulatory protein [Streptomyces sp. WAC08241]RSS37232.1 sensor histidine kinase [Streptomyces sp. WAC08241]
MTTSTRPPSDTDPVAAFDHPVLFYATEEEYLSGVGGAVRAAAAQGRPVLAAVPGERLRLLRDGLGTDHPDVVWTDMRQAGRNPGRILSMLQDFAARNAAGRPFIVGETIWVGRTSAEAREATRHEALMNIAFARSDATVLCPYETALPERVLAQAHRTHPVLAGSDDYRPSPAHTDPHEVCRDCDTPLPEPEDAVVLHFGEQDLADARNVAGRWAEAANMSPLRRTDWLLAVSEAVTNSVRHGGGKGTLRLWRTADTLIAETRDSGRMPDPLIGRRRPDPYSAAGGRGVWMMHQLCDLVEMRASASGLVVRLHMEVA